MQGILLIDKPKGWTSFDVVAKVRGIMRAQSGIKRFKVGHTGTLDPLATGLLVVLVGKDYTKQAPGLTKLDKTYQVTMRLGQTSTTGDSEGEITDVSSVEPTARDVTSTIMSFVGDSMQVPPAYSAVKVDGKRAYALARAGKEVVIEPRPVHIASISNIRYTYPEIYFETVVSSGTYIRSLVSDIGSALQTGAYMSDLRRTTVGSYAVTDAVSMDGITPEQVLAALKD